MTMLRIGNSEDGAVRRYHEAREAVLCELLGRWVSEIEPLVFEIVDYSPTVLVRLGIGWAGAPEPLFVGEVTVDDLSRRLGWVR